MIIFITQKQLKDKHETMLDGLESNYLYFFNSWGTLVPIPNSLDQVYDLFKLAKPDLIILTGGNNINPESYNSQEKLDDLALRRDDVEHTLLDYALKDNIPVIGICRGFHFINVYLGGKLTLNLPNHLPGYSHLCSFENKSYKVNSYHDHGITLSDLSSKLTPIITVYNLVEAFIRKNILGVQWHPERPDGNKELFDLLVKRYLKL